MVAVWMLIHGAGIPLGSTGGCGVALAGLMDDPKEKEENRPPRPMPPFFLLTLGLFRTTLMASLKTTREGCHFRPQARERTRQALPHERADSEVARAAQLLCDPLPFFDRHDRQP
jgi:hypothetical protein